MPILRRIALTIMLACLLANAAPALAHTRTPLWEVVATTDSGTAAATDGSSPALDVRTVGGQVYSTVDTRCKVQVFTILGQLVTERTVESGTVRLTLGNRGIYILKAGATTRRVNL